MINIKIIQDKLPQWLQDSIADVRKQIIGVIVLFVLSSAGILWLKNVLQKRVPLWLVILISLSILFGCAILFLFRSRQSSKPSNYKYCPECDFGINAKKPEIYCQCGTKFLEKCPECNKKIIRDRSRICSFCGYNFPIKPRTGHEWMAH
jgi:hypothetical protein